MIGITSCWVILTAPSIRNSATTSAQTPRPNSIRFKTRSRPPGAGGREFVSTDPNVAIVALGDKELWFRYANQCLRFDGVRWDDIVFRDSVTRLVKSGDHGVLVGVQTGQFYRYERGQLEPVGPRVSQADARLLGHGGFQPYERGLAERLPNEFIPVLVDQTSSRMLYYPDLDDFERQRAVAAAAASRRRRIEEAAAGDLIALPRYTERLEPAGEGSWLFPTSGAGKPQRLLARSLLTISFDRTPLSGRNILAILQSSDGDQWFTTRTGGALQVFRQHLSQAKLELTPPARVEVGRELDVHYALTPRSLADEAHFYSRINGGALAPITSDAGTCKLRFAADGEYQCEIVAVCLGGLVRSQTLTVHASVELPETKWLEKEIPTSLQRFEWTPSAAITQGRPNAGMRIVWRVDGGSWQPVAEDGVLTMQGLARGVHRFEFAGEEDAFWRDATPLEVHIDFQPDNERIVDDYLHDLISSDLRRRRNAETRLLQLDAEAVAVLRRRIQEVATRRQCWANSKKSRCARSPGPRTRSLNLAVALATDYCVIFEAVSVMLPRPSRWNSAHTASGSSRRRINVNALRETSCGKIAAA